LGYRTSRENFARLAELALEELPEEFRKYFTNISIIIEDRPSKEECRKIGVGQDDLLGLFQGTEYPQKGGFFDIPPSLPDEIVLYQKNIEAICSSERELIEEIRLTLVHEVGHYFGLSEEELGKYEP
jgi:predicted Zn-dependent protease with MMP-like domain